MMGDERRGILVIRLDRLGDVVLSTPVLRVLRRARPESRLAVMVRPPCRDVVEAHPDVDEVILYDKEGAHRSAAATIAFARALRGRFDAALVLHPSNRSHWIPWLAGIPVRIGYDRKSGWLLTHRMPHRKQEGERHEAAYTLELVRPLGIEPPAVAEASVPVSPEAFRRVGAVLSEAGIGPEVRPLAVHPSASCVSKRWMPERFAAVADRLAGDLGERIVLVGGKPDAVHAAATASAMRAPAVNLAGRLTVAELIALLSRCRLLLSNDSGPVHLAAAVGTPVVDIFGRNQRGLSPLRWGPLGDGHVILHKEVGCVTCLAHNCDIEFKCLTELGVDEVYQACAAVLARQTAAGS
ncbi:MAG TPA: lipopolysaccharide heptosyltransferase II [bacterium]